MRCFLSIFFFLIFNTLLSAQNFIDPNNEWAVSTCFFNLSTGQTTCQVNNVRFSNSPVLIDNKDYFVLEGDLEVNDNPLIPVGSFYREENGKVFFKHQMDSEDMLLFDFNLQLGDTIFIYNQRLIVGQVDSVELNSGVFRKRLKMLKIGQSESDDGITWIQGVGKKEIPFAPFIDSQDITSDLHCFFSENELELSFEGWQHPGPCTLLSSASEIEQSQTLSLYPNPTLNYLKIEGLSSSFRSASIHNIQGDLIKKMNSLHNRPISTVELNAGVYIITIDNGDGLLTSLKFIKI